MISIDSKSESPQDFARDPWLVIVLVSLALGGLADLLFNGAAPGVNVPLWAAAVIAAFVLIARREGRRIGGLVASLLVVSLGLSMMVAWRASVELQIGAVGTSLALFLLALTVQDDARADRMSITSFVVGLTIAAGSALRGVFILVRSAPQHLLLSRGADARPRVLGRAALITAPLLVVFGGLFVAADAVFQDWVVNALSVEAASVVRHLAWWAGGSVVAAGVLWCALGPQGAPPDGPQLAEARRLRALETGVVLGSLAALFALFVLIQIRYLFGGSEHVLGSIGLTYAEYARRGFFELVAVAVLLLPVLLAADWARARSGRSLTTYRVFGTVLVVLLLVVMTSAFQRLRIYIDVFGLTALRFYAAALLAWLATVFVWLLWSLMRERRNEFVGGAVASALVALVIVVAVNPHGMIAATNLARAEDGRDFDVAYALGLSADATPTLLDGIDALEDDDACEVANAMLARWGEPESDLRSWNWGRAAAADAVDATGERLAAACR